jgi:hypothetical protein
MEVVAVAVIEVVGPEAVQRVGPQMHSNNDCNKRTATKGQSIRCFDIHIERTNLRMECWDL